MRDESPLLLHGWTEPVQCPSCRQGYMVNRTGKFGDFYGCSAFPACRFTLDDYGINQLLDPDPDEPRYSKW